MPAIHIPGGDYFSDVRLDLPASFAAQEDWLPSVPRRSVRRSRLRNAISLGCYAAEWKTGLREPLVMTGIRRKWFDEFLRYWSEEIGGRPITIADFHALHFAYRRRAQITQSLEWDSYDRHLQNWETPENIAATFQFVYRDALRPLRSKRLRRALGHGGRVLEYGCSLAPMYRTWRSFYSHIPCQWVLADIPNFPFHYARHAYAGDKEAEFVTITADTFDDPLRDVAGGFDLIIVQEVFEHLHAPRRIAQYLLDRLRPDGIFAFDYIRKDEALGHDTPAGKGERIATLEYLARELDILDGTLEVGPSTVSLCTGSRRSK